MARDCREQAARVLAAVLADGQSLNQALPPADTTVAERDRGLLQQLCYGTLRHYWQLQGLLDTLLEKPLKRKDQDVHALLLIGLYQLLHTRVPDHAAVASVVDASRKLGKPWARGLLNGVLRRFQREREALLAALSEHAALAHPRWLLDKLRNGWPDHWQQIVNANNQPPPMCLRINARRGDRVRYLQRLQSIPIAAETCLRAPQGVRLKQALDVEQLPGFAEGDVSVQDEAAQYAALLLGAQVGERVLDACAAPGGKACHIAELCTGLDELVALELDSNRLGKVAENVKRLDLDLTLVCGDASAPPTALGTESFQRILVDAPCSASGVIRRHPDIKVLRRPADLEGFAATQSGILRGLWPLLAPGGRLIYATCSVFDEENDAVVDDFITATGDARVATMDIDIGEATRCGRQVLPSVNGSDGLYYAALQKIAG